MSEMGNLRLLGRLVAEATEVVTVLQISGRT
jgi:hypothetical protein